MEPEIFQVAVNEEGKFWIQRFYSLARIVLVATIVVNIMSLAITLPYVLEANSNPDMPSKMWLRNLVFVAYLLFSCVIQTIQVIYYYRFGKRASDALALGDAFSFNRSLRWLYIQSACFLIQLVVTFAYFAYSYLANPR